MNHQPCDHGRRKNDALNHCATLRLAFLSNARLQRQGRIEERGEVMEAISRDPLYGCATYKKGR